MTLDETTIGAYLRGELDPEARAWIEAELDRQPEWLAVVAVMARARARAESSDHVARGPLQEDRRAGDERGLTSVDASSTGAGASEDGELACRRASLAPGARVGRFEILGRIATGGMGVVHEAWDPTLERAVALKIARRRPRDAVARERQLREARTLARLSDPNVVSVFDAGEHEGRVYVAMEMLAGPTLRAHLRDREGPRTAEAIIGLFMAAARGLYAAHRKGIVHRDVKADNVIVEGERVVVVDFGLALPSAGATATTLEGLDEVAGGPMQTDTIAGTLAYMAPEQRRGETITARSDQYSLCVALAEALDDADARPSARLRAVIERGRAADPARRHGDLAELIAALERALAAPRRMVRGLAFAGFAAAAVAAGVGVSWAAREPVEVSAPLDPCAAVEAEQVAIWSPEARARLEAQLRSFDKPYLDELAGRLADAFELRAQDFARASYEVCVARERGLVSDEAHAAQLDCLARRRDELEVFLALDWGAGDEASAATSLTALAALRRAGVCEEPVGLESATVADPGRVGADGGAAATRTNARARVARLRRGLAEVELLHRARRVDVAEARARALVTEAEALGHDPILAELRAELGSVLVTAGDHEAAAAELEAALLTAEARGHDRLSAKLWIAKLHALGYVQARTEEGREAEAHARAWLRRLGEPDELSAEFHRWRGWFEFEFGDMAAASAAFEQALARTREPLTHATIESGLGSALLRAGELDAAEPRLRAAMDASAGILGADHPDVAKTRNNLASLLRARGELDEAMAMFVRSRDSFAAAYGEGHEFVARTDLNIAILELDRGHYARSRAKAEAAAAALTASLGADHPHSLAARGTQASALIRLGRLDEGVALQREVLATQERSLGADHPSLANGYHDLAAGLADAGRHAEAIVEYERALELRERHYGDEHYELAIITLNLGHAHESLGRARVAESMYRRALELATAAIEPEVRSRLGRLLVAEGRVEAGRAQLEQALALYRERGDQGVFLAQTGFALARALWPDADARARALELAREAQAIYLAERDEESAEAVQTWLGDR